jgi:hypothetical protein
MWKTLIWRTWPTRPGPSDLTDVQCLRSRTVAPNQCAMPLFRCVIFFFYLESDLFPMSRCPILRFTGVIWPIPNRATILWCCKYDWTLFDNVIFFVSIPKTPADLNIYFLYFIMAGIQNFPSANYRRQSFEQLRISRWVLNNKADFVQIDNVLKNSG